MYIVAVNTAQVQLAMFTFEQGNFSPSKRVLDIKTYTYKNLKLLAI